MKAQYCPSSHAAWREWLQKHHAKQSEIWLVFFKKHTGKATLTYRDSVEEALCFGWIDGMKRSIDAEQYAHRFTPRKKNSKWSALNISLAQQMIEAGKMKPAGLEAFRRRRLYDESQTGSRAMKALALSAEAEAVLRKNPLAWRNFEQLSPGYRRQYIAWLMTAKRETTRERRLKEAIILLENNKLLGMKQGKQKALP